MDLCSAVLPVDGSGTRLDRKLDERYWGSHTVEVVVEKVEDTVSREDRPLARVSPRDPSAFILVPGD
jgi:hypothetical protein